MQTISIWQAVIRLLGSAPLLAAAFNVCAVEVDYGPYLQSMSWDSVEIRWHTTEATSSRVLYGTVQGNLQSAATELNVTQDHKIKLENLDPHATYYYSIGTATTELKGNGPDHFFVTSPEQGETPPIRMWVLGDSGYPTANQRAVRDAYLQFNGDTYTDLVLMLGDNAYNSGNISEHINGLFLPYETTLHQSALWPTIGNHEEDGDSDSISATGPYYDLFTLPDWGQAGGKKSETEAYYSFDYGNIHFISLNSTLQFLTANNGDYLEKMQDWLAQDLRHTIKARNQTWLIAFWHHSPYSFNGDKTSDSEPEGTIMREQILPILEDYGVDLVLVGHSHAYERSKFIHGHYGKSATFSAEAHVVQSGDGQIGSNGAYSKTVHGHGTVYAVVGASSDINPVEDSTNPPVNNHPAMQKSLMWLDPNKGSIRLGSMVIDVSNDKLDARYISADGVVEDYFSIHLSNSGNKAPIVSAGIDQAVEINGETTLSGNVNDDQSPTVLWSKVDGPGTVAFSNISSPNTTASFPVTGAYTLRLQADDSTHVRSDTLTVRVSPHIVDHMINTGNGDARERGDGYVYMDNTIADDGLPENELRLGKGTVGLRFSNLELPDDAIIDRAYIQFQPGRIDYEKSETNLCTLTIWGEDADSAAQFNDTDNPNFNISNRTKTSASITWEVPSWMDLNAANVNQRTPDLKDIIQEIVDRPAPGWDYENDMVFIITGNDQRTVISRDDSSVNAPVLHIEYH